MIVAGPEGLMKSAYRKFNIRGGEPAVSSVVASALPVDQDEGSLDGGSETPRPEPDGTLEPRDTPTVPREPLTPGDDYAMMREVLGRRFARALKEDPERARGAWPDLVLIDGGAGQLSSALDVFGELGITDVAVAAIAKGPDRNAGRERFFAPGKAPFSLDPRDPVLYFLQRLRDEAHRFAIGTHRARRAKSIGHSLLDDIPGIGAHRKRALLHHFGSARTVARAGLAELERVDGISKRVAKKIYEHFHVEG
jgi:excinuclease ABC subunit C